MTSELINYVLVSGLILIGLFFAFFFLRRWSFKGGLVLQKGPMSVMANIPLGPQKSITLLKIPGAILILGLSKENISLLAEIRDEERIRELEAYYTRDKGFFSILKKTEVKEGPL